MEDFAYTLTCPGCKHQFGCIHPAMPCPTGCGRIAVVVPLDGAFEDAVEGDEIKKPKAPEKKPAPRNTMGRKAEDGGETF